VTEMTDRPMPRTDATAIGTTKHRAGGERREPDDSSAVALVPLGGVFEGQVAVLGRTRLEGTVRGSLRGPGELVLGPEARVEGAVECEAVWSRGDIVGPVIVRTRAYFGDGAHFEGDLDAPALEIEGDVVWNGVAHVGG